MTNLTINGNNENTDKTPTLGGTESSNLPTSGSKLYVPGQEGLVTPSKELWTPNNPNTIPNVFTTEFIIQPEFKNIKRKLQGIELDQDGTLFDSINILQYFFMELYVNNGKREHLSTKRLEGLVRIINGLSDMREAARVEVEIARKEGRLPKLKNRNTKSGLISEIISANANEQGEYVDFSHRSDSRIISGNGNFTDEIIDIISKYFSDFESDIAAINHAKEMICEERDVLLEIDGKMPAGEKNIIPYDVIYSEKYWFPHVGEHVRELYRIFGSLLEGNTAHNGIDDMHGREFDEKTLALHKMEHRIRNRGLRFHPEEYIPFKRRERNPKGLVTMKAYHLESLAGWVFVDDSEEVCKEVLRNGGSPIWVNRSGQKSKYGFATITSIHPINIIRALISLGYDTDDNYVYRIPNNEKTKVYIKAA